MVTSWMDSSKKLFIIIMIEVCLVIFAAEDEENLDDEEVDDDELGLDAVYKDNLDVRISFLSRVKFCFSHLYPTFKGPLAYHLFEIVFSLQIHLQ